MAEQHSMIELQGIIKRFYIGQPNELEILHGIDLKVNRGEFVSIVGSSGSGKTTMMNIIGILDRPTEGEYLSLIHILILSGIKNYVEKDDMAEKLFL